MDKTDTTKDTRGEGRRGVGLEKGWNKGFDHVRCMMAYD